MDGSILRHRRELIYPLRSYQQEILRALILVDYEFGRAGESRITAVDVMHTMTSDVLVDELDPIMLTGNSVLVDDDLVPAFLGEGALHYTRHGKGKAVVAKSFRQPSTPLTRERKIVWE